MKPNQKKRYLDLVNQTRKLERAELETKNNAKQQKPQK